jgi:hypothetical protein
MRNVLYSSGLLILILSGIACSDAFLESNNTNAWLISDTLFLNNYQEDVDTSLAVPVLNNADYTIFIQPKWLSFKSMHGTVNEGILPLTFSILKEKTPPELKTSYGIMSIDVRDIGLISFIVGYVNSGYPLLQCSVSSLNFESSPVRTFTIDNTAAGILKWGITGIPEWLQISQSQGTLEQGNSDTITASIDLNKINRGQEISCVLQIKSNSTSGNKDLQVNVSAGATTSLDLLQISGTVVDAAFDRKSGIMAICTKSPDALILLNTATGQPQTISLSKSPNCIDLSEDGHKAIIGYTVASVSYIDLDKHEITSEYTIDCIPFDIALGDNGWCYISASAGQWISVRNLNLNTGQMITGMNQSTMYEKTMLKKVKGKPYLVGTRTTLSPTGVLIFDVSTGAARDEISYYHTSLGKFWLSEDGSKVFSSSKTVYNLPEYDGKYHGSYPPVFGSITSVMYNITALDESSVLKSFFISAAYNTTNNAPVIEQYSTPDLNKIKSFTISPILVNENGTRKLYEADARYLFVSPEGTKLYALKKPQSSYNKDYWTIETISLVQN